VQTQHCRTSGLCVLAAKVAVVVGVTAHAGQARVLFSAPVLISEVFPPSSQMPQHLLCGAAVADQQLVRMHTCTYTCTHKYPKPVDDILGKSNCILLHLLLRHYHTHSLPTPPPLDQNSIACRIQEKCKYHLRISVVICKLIVFRAISCNDQMHPGIHEGVCARHEYNIRKSTVEKVEVLHALGMHRNDAVVITVQY